VFPALCAETLTNAIIIAVANNKVFSMNVLLLLTNSQAHGQTVPRSGI
jgi:hypothetical protein